MLPDCETLLLDRDGWRLRVTLNRPETRNALSAEMVNELTAVFDAVRDDREVRAIVLRGAGGNFCAGGDIKGFGRNQAGATDDTEVIAANRRYGELLDTVNRAPQAVIAAIEGAVMGGGMGFTCTCDIAVATESARFGLPEATLGLPAAQVGPFVAQRIGLTKARMLAVTGARLKADEAMAVGLIHHVVADAETLEAKVTELLAAIARCAPDALAENKRLLHLSLSADRETVVEEAAQSFATAMRSDAAKEGVAAFLEKRPATWAR